MSRDYQAKKRNGDMYLPAPVYRLVLALVRAYPHMCAQRDSILTGSPTGEGGRVHWHSDPTAQRAMQLTQIDDNIAAIEKALNRVPQEYRQGILNNIIYGTRLIDLGNASERTWSRWKSTFLFAVARYKHLI